MIKNILSAAAGFVFLSLGAIGIFLPVWPTTPFVLLAVASFSGNPFMRQRIMKIRFFREHAENYKDRKGLTKGNVIASLSFLWLSMTISILLMQNVWVTLFLLFIGIAVTIHILLMSKPKRK